MKKPKLLSALIASIIYVMPGAAEDALDPAQVEESITRAADYYLENPEPRVGYRWWHQAPLYDGLLRLSEVTAEPRFLAALIYRGQRSGWDLGDRPYHADDHAVGRAWLELYEMDPSREERLVLTKEGMDQIVDFPATGTVPHGKPGGSLRWTWCDALYMAPPTLARLARMTGDQKYLRFMDLEYLATYEELWDPEDKLFYRDHRFIDKRTEGGKKIFWSRGNGWVYGGLAMILEQLPEGDISRPFYERLYLEMTEGVASAQQESGLWLPSLRDNDHVTVGETSGSSFFIYGMAWGVNHGLLDPEVYWPKIVRGWKGLSTRVREDGFVGYVQPVGADPQNNVTADKTQSYGVGAYIMAGCEILKKVGTMPDVTAEARHAAAMELLESGAFDRVAEAYYVPKRKDDLAWENDRIAFRVYGPPLKDSAERSGIDVWTKRVTKPILESWYEGHFNGQSYHEDRGEGYDGYKVGASRGCGGTGVWYKGKFHTANVFHRGDIIASSPGKAVVRMRYDYMLDGERLTETKTITLEEGKQLCSVESYFHGDPELRAQIRFGVGLVKQTDKAKVMADGTTLTMWDKLGETDLATGIQLLDGFEPGSVEILEDATPEKDSLISAALTGRLVKYNIGFAWELHSDFDSHEAWHAFVKASGN